ncbi:MAG: hypothetical protein WC632_02105 [Candidatus Margulisiibacteriota bacterium]
MAENRGPITVYNSNVITDTKKINVQTGYRIMIADWKITRITDRSGTVKHEYKGPNGSGLASIGNTGGSTQSFSIDLSAKDSFASPPIQAGNYSDTSSYRRAVLGVIARYGKEGKIPRNITKIAVLFTLKRLPTDEEVKTCNSMDTNRQLKSLIEMSPVKIVFNDGKADDKSFRETLLNDGDLKALQDKIGCGVFVPKNPNDSFFNPLVVLAEIKHGK